MALGKYRVQCAINDRNLVERIQTYFHNPSSETCITNWCSPTTRTSVVA